MKRDTIIVAGIQSPILRGGAADSPEAVLFVHGNPGSANDWAELAELVAPHCRVLAPDMPGFGQAGKPFDFNYSADGYAHHLEAILHAEGVTRVHLVLHDLGGLWGLTWAASHIHQVCSITLIGFGILPGYRWHYLARIWQLPIIGELFMAAASRFSFGLILSHGSRRGLTSARIDEMYRNFDRHTRSAVLKLYRCTNNLKGLFDHLGNIFNRHRLPTLVLWGEHDPYIPAKFADVQRQFFDVKTLVRFADSGHWPMDDNPTALHTFVLSFLKTQVKYKILEV